MEIVVIALAILVVFAAYEFRFRKPDQIVVYESGEGVGVRKARLYPRHFSMPITKTAYSFVQTIDASAKGNLDARVKLAVTVGAALDHLGALVRVGGWTADAVSRAAKELEIVLLGYVKEFTELREIEDLSSESIREHLRQRSQGTGPLIGLEVVTLTITSFEPVNAQIAEAMRQREQARILEQTESLNQQARIGAAKARLKADEEIARLENSLALKNLELQQAQLEKESTLAGSRAEHELQLKKMQLEFEKEEMRLLKDSPELLLLTPQAARLAEASQSMKNARTVVSLSPPDGAQGAELLGMFHTLVQNALDAFSRRKEK